MKDKLATSLRAVANAFRQTNETFLQYPAYWHRSLKQNRLEFRCGDFFCILYTDQIKVESGKRMWEENHLRNRGTFDARTYFLSAFLFASISLLLGAAGCGSPKPAQQPGQPEQGPHRYALSGRVVSLDKPKLQVTVDAAEIPGFMMAMTMGYSVKSANLLEPLSPEDQIKADVVVNGEDVSLENIVVVKKADQAKPPASSDAHPGMPPPDKK